MRPMAEDIVIAGCMFWAASLASWVVPRIRRRESEWTRFRRQMLDSPMRRSAVEEGTLVAYWPLLWS